MSIEKFYLWSYIQYCCKNAVDCRKPYSMHNQKWCISAQLVATFKIITEWALKISNIDFSVSYRNDLILNS